MTDIPSCSAEPGCITCGDIALVLTVESVSGADALCVDADGRRELVATDLVGVVAEVVILFAGIVARVLVHAGVAIERVSA